MKVLLLSFLIVFSNFTQHHTPLPHGMVFGSKPSNIGLMDVKKLESFMGKRTRTSASVYATVIKVTKPKGGWFIVDAGNGKTIEAHFKNYDITLPTDLKGRQIIMEGVASKQFIADDLQHFAGDTVVGKKQHLNKTDPKRRLYFEVTGLMVNK